MAMPRLLELVLENLAKILGADEVLLHAECGAKVVQAPAATKHTVGLDRAECILAMALLPKQMPARRPNTACTTCSSYYLLHGNRRYLASAFVSVVTSNGVLESFRYLQRPACCRFHMHETTKLAPCRLYVCQVFGSSGSA